MNRFSIVGLLLLALVSWGVWINFPDIVRYMRMRSM